MQLYNPSILQPTQSHSTTRTTQPPGALYSERTQRFAAQRDHFLQRSQRMANISLALVASAGVIAGLAVWQGSWLLALGVVLLGIGFVVSYSYHFRVDQQHARARDLHLINQAGLHRLERAWDQLPLRIAPASSATPLTHDLDVLGHASLWHLLGTPATQNGQTTLVGWLLQPGVPATINERQIALSELAPLVELRDELALRGLALGSPPPDPAGFVRWAEGDPWLLPHPWLGWAARISPLALVGFLVLQLMGVITLPVWLVFVVLNIVLSLTLGRRAGVVLDQIATQGRVFGAYARLFDLVGQQTFDASALQQVQQRLRANHQCADQQMQRLSRIMALADLRSWMFFPIIELATLWNVHTLWFMERWQRDAGPHARDWLAALGEYEALAALATLHHDHPDWAFPTIVTNTHPRLQARNLGHPLLSPTTCVGNDVELGPPGTFLLVTGSNMSGKSTLLRAIGLNVLLAQAGAPVCAAHMQLSPFELATSMRVQDSLEQGVSYFMAEIQRLKTVVDHAHQVQQTGQHTLLFLLDEILHGTNTGERQIAARQIIRHLLALHAMGAVSTHDLTLGDDPGLAVSSQVVHFTEQFTRDADGPQMRFDYQVRPGLATSTNALALMELIGLPVEPVGAETVSQV